MNGANIGTFDLNTPADTESSGLGDDRIRSVKSTFQQVLDDEHAFSSAGGAAVGYHRLGSARVYVGTQSVVSSSGTEGRIMVTSDTSRLFGVGSAGTVLLGGGPTALSLGTYAGTFPQRHHWVEEVGIGWTSSSGSTTITIPNSGYSGLPFVQLTSQIASLAITPSFFGVLPGTGATFTVLGLDHAGNASSGSFYWRSLGSRVL